MRPVREGWWEAPRSPGAAVCAPAPPLTLIEPPGRAAGARGPAAPPDTRPDPRIEVGERTASGGVQVRPLAALDAVLAHYGQVPLPPYIQRPLTDAERYQTIYGQREGSAAAPTAGLHFTPQLLDQLRAKQVQLAFVTLHIGPDTFRPIRTETVEGSPDARRVRLAQHGDGSGDQRRARRRPAGDCRRDNGGADVGGRVAGNSWWHTAGQ